MSDDELVQAIDELCRRGYELPEEREKAVALAKRCHFLVSCHYPLYRDSFVASAEGDMIERIFAVLMHAGETWESNSVKAIAAYRERRLIDRQQDENR